MPVQEEMYKSHRCFHVRRPRNCPDPIDQMPELDLNIWCKHVLALRTWNLTSKTFARVQQWTDQLRVYHCALCNEIGSTIISSNVLSMNKCVMCSSHGSLIIESNSSLLIGFIRLLLAVPILLSVSTCRSLAYYLASNPGCIDNGEWESGASVINDRLGDKKSTSSP